NRRRQQASGNQTGRMRDVRKQIRANFVGNFAESPVVERTTVRAGASNDRPWANLLGARFHNVIVDQSGLLVDAIEMGIEEPSGEVHGEPMREVATLRQAEPEDLVSRID